MRKLRFVRALMLLAGFVGSGLVGCNGRSIKVDNPVFAAAPPRRSLINPAADAEEQRLVQGQAGNPVQPAGFSRDVNEPLTATTIVAQVNGKPIFLDDVMGGTRQIIERQPNLPPDRRNQIIEQVLRKRLPKYVEDELIVQALEKKIPEEKRKSIRESLEPEFQKVVADIKKKEGFVTDQQLNDRLAEEGMSITLLRDNFVRMQMVEGYVGSMCKVPETVDREVLLKYYQDHIADFTPDEEVRFSEIVIRFRDHGGREGAEQAMANVMNQLQSGKEFGEVAQAMSDTLTREKRGEVGWIKRGALSDKALEEMLFTLPAGTLSKVQVRDDRLEVYKVTSHRNPGTAPFQEVQRDIEQDLLRNMKEDARKKVRREIHNKGNVVTIFGDSLPLLNES